MNDMGPLEAHAAPHVFNVLCGEAMRVQQTPYGAVGLVHTGEGIELVWVSKQDELVNSGWFSQAVPDLIIVMQGQLRVEFEAGEVKDRILQPGDVLVLPASMKCRAYRWPRDARQATVFVATYPTAPAGTAR